jgi:hypothetical protein
LDRQLTGDGDYFRGNAQQQPPPRLAGICLHDMPLQRIAQMPDVLGTGAQGLSNVLPLLCVGVPVVREHLSHWAASLSSVKPLKPLKPPA